MTHSRPTQLGTLLRRLRLASGLSQEQLAERSGLSARAISDLERGLRPTPHSETIRMLSQALGLTENQRADLLVAVHPELRTDADELHRPASPTAASGATLPRPPTVLIGRDEQVETLLMLLRSGGFHLITLTGPAGVGKTRLALEVARAAASSYQGGAYFVDLAAVRDPDGVALAIVRTLGLQESADRSIRKLLADALAARPPLLLLVDNFEQVIDAAPVLIDIVNAAPAVQVLTTSREALRLRGETEIVVQPLELPADVQMSDAELLGVVPAVALFVRTATLAQPEFVLTSRNAAAVAAICIRLEGLPLALEIAATRVRHFRPEDLLEHLERRLPALTGGPRDLPERQQSVRNAIAWSYDLLDPAEQALFRRMGVLAGGGDVDAIFAMSPGGGRSPDALNVLASLIDKHLVVQHAVSGAPRFTMLELIREFAVDQLTENGEYENARRSHAAYFKDLVERRGPAFVMSHRGFAGHGLVEAELANIRAASSWFIEQEDGESLATIVVFTWHYFYVRSMFGEINALSERALEFARKSPISPRMRAIVLALLSMSDQRGHEGRALPRAEESVAIARTLPPETGILRYALISLTIVNRWLLRFEEATAAAQEALEANWALDDPHFERLALYHLGRLAYLQDDFERAAGYFEASLDQIENLGPSESELYAVDSLAAVRARQGRFREAVDLLRRGLALAERDGFRGGVGLWFETVYLLAERCELWKSSAQLYGFMLNTWRPEIPRQARVPPPYILRTLDRLHEAMSAEAFTTTVDEGAAFSHEQAIAAGLKVLEAIEERSVDADVTPSRKEATDSVDRA